MSGDVVSEGKQTRNSAALASFIKHCQEHPDERFWQALSHWSGWPYIYVSTKVLHHGEPPDRVREMFNMEGSGRHERKWGHRDA